MGTASRDLLNRPLGLPSLHSQAAMGLSREGSFPHPKHSRRRGGERFFWFCF